MKEKKNVYEINWLGKYLDMYINFLEIVADLSKPIFFSSFTLNVNSHIVLKRVFNIPNKKKKEENTIKKKCGKMASS